MDLTFPSANENNISPPAPPAAGPASSAPVSAPVGTSNLEKFPNGPCFKFEEKTKNKPIS